MKLSQIAHVIAVAEGRSLKRTAEETGTSPNALSRSIGEIERELGTALFKRSSKAMTLTAVGKIFVRRAAAAQCELDQARREISERAGGRANPDDAHELSALDVEKAPSAALSDVPETGSKGEC